MTSIVFSTPGLIPIEAFTTFGMSAKPMSTNPFGKFGTGLKIAVAVCLRMGQQVVVWRGHDKYTFYTKPQDFRGKEFAMVKMKREKWKWNGFRKSYHDLPFTTELGKHWELWQAFREFQTNTMDENGVTLIAELQGEDHNKKIRETYQGHEDTRELSHIVVTGSKFVDEYHDRGRNFLEDGLTERSSSDRIQVLEKPSKHIYFRGVRIYDLKEEAAFTYNFLMDVDLTEDRTAKYPFMLESAIAEYFMTTENEAHVEAAVKAPQSQSFERSLPYRYTSVSPSSSFVVAARESPNIGAKQLVKVAESVASSTIITIRVPKPSITDEEMANLEAYCKQAWGEDTALDCPSNSC